MNQDIIKLESNHVILLSEDNNSDSADAKFIICDFQPNENSVSINRDTIEDWLSTLFNKPVVGKVVTRIDGKKDFSGHNAKVVEEVDEEGNKYKTLEFDTQAFGSFYSVQIETIDNIEYITATAKIWKRFKQAYSVFKKRVESEKGLKTSWEINVSESHKEKIKNKNVKVIDLGEFIGHCLLGENVTPAYKSSGVINVATFEHDNELAEAFQEDILALSEDINEDKDNINKLINANKGGNESVGDTNKDNNQTSALTENDIYRKVRKAINNSSSDKYYYMAMIYPYDFKAIAYDWNRDKDSDFVEFTYSVNSDDTVSITSQKDVEMIFKPKSNVESQISELQSKLDETEKQIAEAGKLLTEVSKEKEGLVAQIAELEPFKEKVEQLEQAEKERELAEKKEELKTFALEDDLISAEELETDEKLSSIFAELTVEGYESAQEKIEVIKGRKAIAKFKENKELSNKEDKNEEAELETSETQTNKKPKTNLNNSDSDQILVSAVDIVKSWVGKK